MGRWQRGAPRSRRAWERRGRFRRSVFAASLGCTGTPTCSPETFAAIASLPSPPSFSFGRQSPSSGSRPGPIRAFSSWPGPSPTWRASRKSPLLTSARPSITACWIGCGYQRRLGRMERIPHWAVVRAHHAGSGAVAVLRSLLLGASQDNAAGLEFGSHPPRGSPGNARRRAPWPHLHRRRVSSRARRQRNDVSSGAWRRRVAAGWKPSRATAPHAIGSCRRLALCRWRPLALWLYDEAADRWIERASLPEARGASAASAAGGRLILVGGMGDGAKLLDSIAIYDPTA